MFKPCLVTLHNDPKKSVNHGVPGSSPGEGAKLDKPSEMMAFSLSINELRELYFLYLCKIIRLFKIYIK